MNISKWYQKRSPKFIWQRGRNILTRYGLTGSKAENRIEQCIKVLASMKCSPTFFVPGMVVERHPGFIKYIRKLGAEIAVHGYNHVDLSTCPPEDASGQLLRAVQIFEKNGLDVHGFRCPYLSCTDELLREIPLGVFEYSSNKAIKWDVSRSDLSKGDLMVDTIDRFYTPQNAQSTVCVPWVQDGLVEIPVCVPDDLQLMDGYQMSPTSVAETWIDLSSKIYQRGELFNLMFHPELGSYCIYPILKLLDAANRMHPGVWMTNLEYISRWWIEKAGFSMDLRSEGGLLYFNFNCNPRATILCRDLKPVDLEQANKLSAWDGRYFKINAQSIAVSDLPRPLVGVSSEILPDVVTFLQEQGYILDRTSLAAKCTIFLDHNSLKSFSNHLELIEWIEKSHGPLVRFWRWPDGAKSALSITGDLDALSLLDYVSRIL
jgi:hypothetical protein